MSDAAGTIPEPPETIEVTETTVACDGGGGALGHPRVYLTLKGAQRMIRVSLPPVDHLALSAVIKGLGLPIYASF